MYVHKIPIHLETEDKFVYSLTLRQCVVLGIGATLAYTGFFSVFTSLPNPGLGFTLGLLTAFSLLICGVALAFVKVFGRGLGEWATVLLVYLMQPHIYLWRFATPDVFEQFHQRIHMRRRGIRQNPEDDTW